MASSTVVDDGVKLAGKKFADSLQNDLRTLSNEAKKKHQPVKEAAEAGIARIRNLLTKNDDIISALQRDSPEILQPFILGCDTKNPKVVQVCVAGIQRLIAHGALSPSSADKVVACLWTLMEIGVEEVKLLQTILLLLNSGDGVKGDALAKALALCLRLHVAKDSTTVNAASATVRQLVSLVFERVADEDRLSEGRVRTVDDINVEELKVCSAAPPKSLEPCAADAYMLFQDLVQLINADRPFWLVGLVEMSRSLGLELLEELLTTFDAVFSKHKEQSFLLKERVCPLIIKLFSPNIKHRGSGALLGVSSATGTSASSASNATAGSSASERPCFAISVRLLRIVSVLIHKYHAFLATECEIFLSLVVKFLEPDKPSWQRALALGVLHRMMVSPQLVQSFCHFYDSKPHSTKILRDIVNALGAYVQTLFVSPSSAGQSIAGTNQTQVQGMPPSLLGGLPMGPGVTPQPAFIYHGVWIPISVSFPAGTTKSAYLDLLDKTDVGQVPDSYGVSLAFACLLDVVRSVTLAVEGPSASPPSAPSTQLSPTEMTSVDSNESKKSSASSVSLVAWDSISSPPSTELKEQLVESTWCGLLAAFCLLLEASTDESASESILKAMQSYVCLAGSLDMTTARDAFVTALCKASLPPYYTLTVLSDQPYSSSSDYGGVVPGSSASYPSSMTSMPNASQPNTAAANAAGNNLAQYLVAESEYRPQVVAVGTPLLTSSLQSGGNQGSVVLTTKNLQCMRSILVLAHCHGTILGNAWHLVLTTLQHLVWILGLKPATGGSLKAGRANEGPNTVLTTAVLADLPVLSVMLSRLFESSQYLDDVALHHLVDALCRLSQESMELAYTNREPSLFAVAKLLETGLVNLPRLEVLWRPLTNHLLEVSRHPHVKMREWGVEAITTLVKDALARRVKPASGGSDDEIKADMALCLLILAPIRELSHVPHLDVRQRQLDCVLQVLHNNGESLVEGWPVLLEVIAALSDNHGENLVRSAFQCLQLVVTDFLPTMPSSCLLPCIDTVAHFGLQSQELNVSLSAVGLLWNVADHLHQNRDQISEMLESAEAGGPDVRFPGTARVVGQNIVDQHSSKLLPFERLWMSLYSWLSELCVDPRSAVRKSAGQTLFSTVNAHGSILRRETWQSLVWKVLFPLLDRVRSLSGTASSDKMDLGGNILIHHSRNTAQKQWAETQVLVLAGVARVFAAKRELLQTLGDFARAWALLLEFIEAGALGRNDEVSLAALKSFQEILLAVKTEGSSQPSETSSPEEAAMWTAAWKVWYKIGSECAKPVQNSTPPSQGFLTALVQIFPPLYRLVRSRFVASDLQKLSTVMHELIAVPILGEAAFVLLTAADGSLTPLQEAILQSVEVLRKTALSGGDGNNLRMALPQLMTLLLSFSECACRSPAKPASTSADANKDKNKNSNSVDSGRATPVYWAAAAFVPFAEKALEMAIGLYVKTADWKIVIEASVFRDLIKTLRLPLSLKYSCPSLSTWKLAIQSLFTVLSIGLPVARKHEKEFVSSWLELSSTLEEFLFSKSTPPSSRTLEEAQADEAIDCKVVQVIRDEILARSATMPKEFILKIVSLLDRGSIHSAGSLSIEPESVGRLREEFARLCFETLLQYSFVHAGGVRPLPPTASAGKEFKDGGNAEATGRLAVTALLHRFKEVISKYVQDEKLGGKCPLPRHRTAEMAFVLKAASTLTVALKKAPSKSVSNEVWRQLIDMYPPLVECTTSSSPQVALALKEALSEYHDLMRPPSGHVTNGV